MDVDPITVVFEIVNFALLVAIMLRFVFRPVREVLARRTAELAERARETEAREAEAAAVRAKFEAELARIDTLAEQRVEAALSEARGSAHGILEAARTSAHERISEAEAELEHARRRALTQFRGDVLRLGTEAARRLVRELGDAELGLAFARRALHALDDAAGPGHVRGPIEIHHSDDIDADALAELVRAQLGPGVELRLHVDDNLIAGVRLAAQGLEVEASAGASLDDWYRSLERAA
jgi:F-type H+-transporting ATPase subunit b